MPVTDQTLAINATGIRVTSVEAWELSNELLGAVPCGVFESACASRGLGQANLVAAWLFDEESAGAVRELKGRYPLSQESSSAPGVTAGLAAGTTTKGARSFLSDGSTKMGRAIDAPLFDALASSNYGLSWWMQPTASSYILYAGGPTGDSGGSSRNILLQLQVLSNGKVRVFWEVANGANVTLDTSGSLTLGQTYHAVLNVEPASASKADVALTVRDTAGDIVLTHTWTNVSRTVAGDIGIARWVLGGRLGATGGFAGVVDNMALFASPLSDEQAAALHVGEARGVVASWQLGELRGDSPIIDAMGRYSLDRMGADLIAPVSGILPHDVLYTGARRFDGTAVTTEGTEHLSDVFQDWTYTVMASFRPDTTSGSQALVFYGGPIGDGYSGRDNYLFQLSRVGDEIEIFWETGIGYNLVLRSSGVDLVAGHDYSVAVTVTDEPGNANRRVRLDTQDWTTDDSSTVFWYNKTRATRGQTDRMQLSLAGRTSLGEGNLLHGVLDDVLVFSPALSAGEVSDIWGHKAAAEVVCAPSFGVVSLDGGEMQQSSLSGGEGLIAGPGAGTLEAWGGGPGGTPPSTEPAESVESEVSAETTDAADGDPASEPGADVEVAPAMPGAF